MKSNKEFEKTWGEFITFANNKYSHGQMSSVTKDLLKEHWLKRGLKELQANFLKIKKDE